jgi:hypothetical protein
MGAQATNPAFLSTQATQNNGFAGGIQGRNDGSGTAGVAFDANIRGALVGGLQVQDSGFWGTDVRLLANRTGSNDADRRFVAMSINSGGAQFSAHVGNPLVVLPQYSCRAWVNFNGTNGAISAGGNVSSVVRNGVGDYTVNFSTAMPDANYGVSLSSDGPAGTTGRNILTYSALASSSLRIYLKDAAGTQFDSGSISVAIFR